MRDSSPWTITKLPAPFLHRFSTKKIEKMGKIPEKFIKQEQIESKAFIDDLRR